MRAEGRRHMEEWWSAYGRGRRRMGKSGAYEGMAVDVWRVTGHMRVEVAWGGGRMSGWRWGEG